MKLTNKDMVKNTIVSINQIQEHQKAVMSAFCRADDLNRGSKDTVNCGNLLEKLYQSENELWRNLFAWGLTLEADEQKDIKALAHARILSDEKSVAHHFNDGVTPGQWLSKDEKEFRKICKEYFSK